MQEGFAQVIAGGVERAERLGVDGDVEVDAPRFGVFEARRWVVARRAVEVEDVDDLPRTRTGEGLVQLARLDEPGEFGQRLRRR